MKLTFIRPNFNQDTSHDAMQPLAFSILSGLTPGDIERELYDERIETIPARLETDLVAISVDTFTAKRAYRLSAHYRSQGIPVVMGGYHPTIIPEEAQEYADAIVVGEPETVWRDLLADAAAKRLKRRYESSEAVDISRVPYDRSIFHGKKYLPAALIQFSRGCKYHCDFCNAKSMYGHGVRFREVNDVITEINATGATYLFFTDDNLYSDRERFDKLLEALAPLGKRWGCQVSIDIAFDDDLLRRMRKSGCVVVLIGFESLSNANLKTMSKQVNIHYADYPAAIKRIKQQGMMVYGSFLIGYEEDEAHSADELAQFAIENQLFLANFNPLMPLPKTKQYDRLQQAGRLLFDGAWWLEEQYRYGESLFLPENMSPEMLRHSIFKARRRFYAVPTILRRLVDNQANLKHFALFTAGNVAARRELHRKEGMVLG